MTDQEKVIKLFDELNIKCEVNGNTIYIDNFECDGAEEFGISFWDGEYYPEGSYHEFWVVPCQQTLKSTSRPQGKWIIKSNGTTSYYACSKCGSAGDFQDKFCRDCGANMKSENSEHSEAPCYQTTSCLDCKMYDKENHHCPRFCEVIRELVKETEND